MKVFMDKRIVKRVLLVVILIILFGFIFSGNVQADSEVGGKLLKPFVDMILGLGDGIFNIVHYAVLQQKDSLITISLNSTVLETIATVGVWILAAAAAAAAVILTAGVASAVIGAISGITLSTVGVGTVILVSVVGGTIGATVFNSNVFPDDKLELPIYKVSVEEIFKNELEMFDVDFFSPQKTKIVYTDGTVEYTDNETAQRIQEAIKEGRAVKYESTAKQLRTVVSNWYQILRNISLVALLSVLVYIGIRILISSTSNEKAKYKQFLMDWVVAICLLFIMHYIMAFANMAVKKVTNVISSINNGNESIQIIEDKDGKITKKLTKIGYSNEEMEKLYVKDSSGNYKTNGGNKYIYWNTNLIGVARLNAQMEAKQTASYAGYTMIFIVLVFYTIFFIFTYLKRIIYMAFLTLIAPLVALTYPIDKMNDGKAQAFNMWFKEYIFNLLIQPMHLILYTVLITTAFGLAQTNMLYSLVAIGFICPSEKLLRKFFGFEKASTPGMFAGPAGAAATMEITKRLFGKPPHGAKDSIGGKNTSDTNTLDDGNKSKIKYKDIGNELFSNSGETSENKAKDARSDLDNRTNKAIQNNISQQNQTTGTNASNQDTTTNVLNPNTETNTSNQSTTTNTSNQGTKKPVKNKKIKKSNNRITRALGAGARYYAHGMNNKMKVAAKKHFTARNIAGKMAGVAMGAVGASVGLATGIVTGDPSKAIQNTIAGGTGGYKFANSTAKAAVDTFGVNGTLDYAKQNYYTDDGWNKKQIQDNIKNFKNNFENKEYVRNKFNGDKEKMNEFMNNVVPMCQEKGLTDMKDAETFWDMKHDPTVKGSDNMILNAIKESKKQDTTDFSAKANKEYNDTLLMKSNQNQEVATNARKLIDKASKLRYHNN